MTFHQPSTCSAKEDDNSIKVAVRLKVSGSSSGSGFQNIFLEKERRETGAYNKSQIRLSFIDHNSRIS